LWTFLRETGVEPTNNAAERAVRPAVLWRKKSSGHQSEAGKQFVERMLSVSATLRQQGRSLLTFLEASLRAVAAGHAPPSVFAIVSG
jgi:transposase